MRIHVQSLPGDPAFQLTEQRWHAACSRAGSIGAGAIGAGHSVTFGADADALAAGLLEAEALVTQTSALAQALPVLPPAPRLRLIYCTAAGLDSLAPFTWLPAGVQLLNNRGTHGHKAGEYGLMALLMLANRMPAYATAQRASVWAGATHGTMLAGQRLLVVGLGTLGGAIAERAAAAGMIVTGVRTTATPHPACTRVVDLTGLDAALAEADMLVLAVPLTNATRDLLDRRRLALLPAHAGVVNIGRGALLDQDALCDALDAGTLGGAILDVFTPEPVPAGHRLWTTRNLIMTPHMSADDPATYVPLSLDIFFSNLAAWTEGRPLPNLFKVARGY